jgi:transposase
MNTRKRYPKELKERAVRMVLDHKDEYPSKWQAILAISAKLDISSESLRIWIRQHERDQGLTPGLTTNEREEIKRLKRENRELKRANEILKSAAAFFGAELDRQPKK